MKKHLQLIILLVFAASNYSIAQSFSPRPFPGLKSYILQPELPRLKSVDDKTEKLKVLSPIRENQENLDCASLFCNIEMEIEKRSKLAPRMRLGCVDYINAMERVDCFQTQLRNIQVNGH